MPKNLIIDGRTLEGVISLKATDADTNQLVAFIDTSDATATAADITAGKSAYANGAKVDGTNTGVAQNDLDGIIDGSITSFTMPSGKTNILQYRFYQFTNLTSANLGGATTIGERAFAGCERIVGMNLPASLINIGAYAFQSVGSSSGSKFSLTTDNVCTVGSYGFQSSKIQKVIGKFSAISDYAFDSCTSLDEIELQQCTSLGSRAFYGATAVTSVKAKINGAIGSYAFYNQYSVAECTLDPDSVITSFGDYAFSRFGGNRANAETKIFLFDLQKSTFTSIPQYCFGGDSSSTMYRNKYMKILFPNSLSTINGNAFRYSDYCDYYFFKESPPTLSATTCWANATNYNIFVPYHVANAYRTATNWSAQANFIKGFAQANTFEVGKVLPEISSEGYGLTWYSDTACTNEVTTVDDASAEYYCVVGTEKLAYGIKSVSVLDCNVIITDGVKTYIAGDDVLTGTVLTITGVPTVEGYVPYIFKVNGVDFISGNTLTVDSDLSITAIYYDGVNIPINPTFSENTWDIIYQAFRAGTAAQFWSVGDTKPVTLTDGKTYTIRIADLKQGRYALANGTGSSNGVLEFVECFNVNGITSWAINSSSKEGQWAGGGWSLCDMRNIHMNTIYNLFPEDLKNAISEVSMSEYSYTSPSPRGSTNKLFLPAETEMFSARSYSAEGVQTGCPKYDQFGYYAANNTNATRIKRDYASTSARLWWLRSPVSGSNSSFCVVLSGGSANYGNASNSGGVSPCFAI